MCDLRMYLGDKLSSKLEFVHIPTHEKRARGKWKEIPAFQFQDHYRWYVLSDLHPDHLLHFGALFRFREKQFDAKKIMEVLKDENWQYQLFFITCDSWFRRPKQKK